jgi:hypothetical protein
MSVFRFFTGILLASLGCCVASAVPPDFEREVAPLLLKRCIECHQSRNPSGGLSLDHRDGVLRGGESGAALKPGDVTASLLMHRVQTGEMPPPSNGNSRELSAAEKTVLREWIASGAEFPAARRLDLFEATTDSRGGRDWWAFQPLKEFVPPAGDENEAAAIRSGQLHPIDAFLRAERRTENLTAAPPADPQVLLRRLSWDLTGLPPQTGPAASIDPQSLVTEEGFAAAVETLLASPQYGERWARHWLDVVRYADTSGYERDQPKPFAWKYRDWVVRAINMDMPWADFVRQQLAGDELPERSEQTVIATGFLRLGTWNDEPNDPADYQWERIEDMVHVASTAFLGLTVKCARCHDHKFDPIPQADYYRIASAFAPGPIAPRDGKLLGGPSAEELGIPEVLGWTDITATPPRLRVLKNGDRHRPGEEVSAGGLSCVGAGAGEFAVSREGRTSGLRRQLAEWIVNPANPLPPRVFVNRLWMHHFGEGLLRSVDNFGFTGGQPDQPKLLDWLASEFVRSGGSLKQMHRLMLTSAAWKQSSVHPREAEYQQRDAGNRKVWKAQRRRMDAESLRDALLGVSGELDLRMGGPGFVPTVSREALEGLSRRDAAWNASPESEQRRRSLYQYVQRSLLPPLMTTFDVCDSTLPCGRRDVSIVAPQALTLLNNDFVHARALALAAVVHSAAGTADGAGAGEESVAGDMERLVDAVWRRVLNRAPNAVERSSAVAFLQKQERVFAESAEAGQQTAEASDTLQPVLRRISSRSADRTAELPADCVLFLDAAAGLKIDGAGDIAGDIVRWQDQSIHGHDALQEDRSRRPELQAGGINDQPAIYFSGERRFLHVSGRVLSADECTIIAVTSDAGGPGHRELISNWSGRDGNSTASLFVGLTGERALRFSDALSGVGEVQQRERPFVLTAVNGAEGARLYQQQRLAARGGRLPERRLDTPWVIGQQGNIDGEYWTGQLALLLVFNRELSDSELQSLWGVICRRYGIAAEQPLAVAPPSPRLRALASLGLVLLNSNEFMFVD